jgi:hypothetical protein
MPDFLAVEMTRQRLDRVERAAEEGARRDGWLRAVSAERRARRHR